VNIMRYMNIKTAKNLSASVLDLNYKSIRSSEGGGLHH